MRNKRSGLLNLSLKKLIFAVIFLPIAVPSQGDMSRETEPLTRLHRARRGLTIQHSMVEHNDLNGMVSRAFVRLESASEIKSIVVDREDQGLESQQNGKANARWFHTWLGLTLAGILVIVAIAYFGSKKIASLSKSNEKPAQKPLKQDSPEKLTVVIEKEASPEAKRSSSELVFFVGEHERFELDDLLEATADLRSHSVCSTLYKVGLKNNKVYAVKRLRNLQISFEDFGVAMRRIGNVKHRNVLPLVAYSSTPEDKLLIYKYHDNGSLLNLLEDYVLGKREFPWAHRLSIAGGVARGLTFIYSNKIGDDHIIPHGNIKPSNILVGESDEPLIGEFGHSKLVDPEGLGLCSSKGYAAPERALTEKSDVYSFGVILLELLTGKVVERATFDLPKWVNAMIREEWTGEVFDKNLARSEMQWAFPMLNVALKCVSYFPENRPTFSEVLERIEELYCAEEDHVESPVSSANESHRDCCVLHSIIPETWDSPGSNY